MNTIIIATDYSPAANNALQYAANLASVVKADLVLFNSYHLSPHAANGLVSPTALEQMIDHNNSDLQKLANETARKYGLKVSWVSKASDTIGELSQFAADRNADLVVMGMETNLIEYELFGNTTTAAIKRLNCPVLVVPGDVPFKGIQKILYAYEHTCLDQDNHLDLMKEIARKFAAELQVFHVDTKAKAGAAVAVEDEMISAVDNLLEDVDHSYSVIGSSKIGEGIVKGVEAFQADLLVIVPHKTGFLESLLKGSNTRSMTLKTRVPLLVLPNANMN
ncbi:universal stress protein [Imperialibacter roseus]|uniref:Universal stress protein n=1 Tax=Imperialibacter roseus TaxID=1324217 RepID=A0ABZ0II81_9BACT|nr:universal stress protein [Imperialibacter roseus]WOK04743.1 universal stress protein [Imperialibacter roseus]